MWSDNPTSVYVVIAVGAFLGRTCNAAAGFGAGIMVVCVWVIFECAGIYPGALKQAIVCSSVSSAVMVPMMLYVTRACSTADLRLVATILATTSLSAPVGAAILLRLNRHQVQIFMGCAVLAFIVMEQSATWFNLLFGDSVKSNPMWHMLQQLCSCEVTKWSKSETAPGALKGAPSTDMAGDHQKSDDACSTADGIVVVLQDAPAAGKTMSAVTDPLHQRLIGAQAAGAAAAAAAANGSSSSCNNGSSSSSSSSSDGSSSKDDSRGVSSGLHIIRANSTNVIISSCSSSSSSRWGGPRFRDLFSCCQGRKASSSQQSTMKLVGYGFVAASVSGLMSALTGVGGPPLMIMYRALDTPKDIVRGTNAFIEMFAVRLITYYYMGLLRQSDLQLYFVACSAATLGVVVGNQISGKLNQQAFRRVLLVLMVMCSCLMFVSGFGWLRDR